MSEGAQRIDARLPLALLRAIQQQDTPPELLPQEDVSAFFPHRLGLSDVIEVRIRQFRRMARLRRRVDRAQVEALLELISRRSDAGDVFSAAGRGLAGLHFSGAAGSLRRLARRLPRPLRRRAAARALRRAHASFLIAATHSVEPRTLEIRATDALTARVGEYGAACKLYGSLAENLLEMSGLGPLTVAHPECQRRGHERCVWRAEFPADGGR